MLNFSLRSHFLCVQIITISYKSPALLEIINSLRSPSIKYTAKISEDSLNQFKNCLTVYFDEKVTKEEFKRCLRQ